MSENDFKTEVELKGIVPFSDSTHAAAHIVFGTVEGKDHTLYRRTIIPTAGGSSITPETLVTEFLDDFQFLKAAGEKLIDSSEGEGFTLTQAGGDKHKVRISNVESGGILTVKITANIDGEESEQMIPYESFRQQYFQGESNAPANFFMSAVATELVRNKDLPGIKPYLGVFEVEATQLKPAAASDKNFAMPHAHVTAIKKTKDPETTKTHEPYKVETQRGANDVPPHAMEKREEPQDKVRGRQDKENRGEMSGKQTNKNSPDALSNKPKVETEKENRLREQNVSQNNKDSYEPKNYDPDKNPNANPATDQPVQDLHKLQEEQKMAEEKQAQEKAGQ